MRQITLWRCDVCGQTYGGPAGAEACERRCKRTAAGLFDRVAGELPEEWGLEILLERHGGAVVLTDPNGDEADFPTNRENIVEEVEDALRHAITEAPAWEAKAKEEEDRHAAFLATTSAERCRGFGGPAAGLACCDRAGQYNGYGSDGPRAFACPKGCACHD